VVTVMVLWAAPVSADWSGAANKSTGSMGMASIGYTFTPVKNGSLLGSASGTGGATYVSTAVGLGSIDYFNITNNSSVSANPTVTLTASFTGVSIFPSTTIYSCSVAWNTTLGTCSTGAVLMAAPYPSNTSPAYAWGNMTTTATAYMQVLVGGSVGTVSLTATVGQSGVRAGMDRTTG
jgi:hypothetical protein